ncbi:SusD/RagB family nutrient-binding outer membrane lipoprotein [Chitinophaga defluvii]|uniref:SusD/RagB family nutrient-binding outer membrane lipoprotein n=1 Tax=Chitinophaga defluvii TaxID=3163343 RepID=A0ABV2TAT7_9BACT
MNIQRKIYIAFLALTVTAMGCRKGFEEMNKPWKESGTTDIGPSFNAVVRSMLLGWQEQATFTSFIYASTQQGIILGETGYHPEEAGKELWFNYFSTIADVRLLEKMIDAKPDQSKMKHIRAMLKVLVAYKTLRMVDYFGSIPYFEGGRSAEGPGKYRVKYDDPKVIYDTCLADLKWAITNLAPDPSQETLAAYETFLNGDVAKWAKFANSLRLRYAVRMYEVNKAEADKIIADALQLPLIADGEDIGMWPLKISGLLLDGRTWSFGDSRLRLGTTMWKLMSDNNNEDGTGIFDPRCVVFFEPNTAGKWKAYPQNPDATAPGDGGTPYNGLRETGDWLKDKGVTNFSSFNFYITRDNNTIPELMITADEVHFTKAEIYLRGMGVGKNVALAGQEYEKGIRAAVSLAYQQALNSTIWKVNKPAGQPSVAQMNKLLTNTKVAFKAGDEAAALKQIYAQQWIGNFRQPEEAWALQKRTNYATPMETVNAQLYATTRYGKMRRLTYPTDEQNYNHANWEAATGGTDSETKNPWWMK